MLYWFKATSQESLVLYHEESSYSGEKKKFQFAPSFNKRTECNDVPTWLYKVELNLFPAWILISFQQDTVTLNHKAIELEGLEHEQAQNCLILCSMRSQIVKQLSQKPSWIVGRIRRSLPVPLVAVFLLHHLASQTGTLQEPHFPSTKNSPC